MLEKLGSDLVRGLVEVELPYVKVDLAGCSWCFFQPSLVLSCLLGLCRARVFCGTSSERLG